MRPRTVSEVIDRLRILEKNGYGDHLLLVSNDEECNGYHELYGNGDGEGEPMRYYDDRIRKIVVGKTIMFS